MNNIDSSADITDWVGLLVLRNKATWDRQKIIADPGMYEMFLYLNKKICLSQEAGPHTLCYQIALIS